MSDCYETLHDLVHKALESENLKKYELKFGDGNEKGEGYIGDITFVDVLAENHDGIAITYNLVLKTARKSKTQWDIVKLGFEREIQIYDKIVLAFHKLQIEQNMQPFQAIPKCYLTLSTNNQDALVLQNIKSMGFQLYNRKIAMNLDHIKLVLKILGQWHALSFALQIKKPDEFKKLTLNWKSIANEVFVKSHIGNWLNITQQHLYAVLKNNGELELLQKYKDKIRYREARNVLKEILNMNENQIVINHGDCWNNNVMFKYENDDLNLGPSDVAFLDFQISTLSSPVIDLSYFIYCVASDKELEHFDELLQTYYKHFSDYLRQLHCDPEVIFPYSSLKLHWKKYSAYGTLLQPMTVCDALVDKDDAASYGDKNQNYESIIESINNKYKKEFTSRLIAVARHFTLYDC